MRQRRTNILTEEDLRRFEKIFLPYLDAAFNLARWIIRQDQDAQDVVQNAYIRALKGFHLFRGGNTRGWLLTIVRNTAYTSLNRSAAEEEEMLIRYEEEKHANIISIDNPDKKLLAELRKEYLQRALEGLPLELCEVTILYELEGLS